MAAISQEHLLPIGDEWVRTDKMDTIRLPYDGSVVMDVPQGDPALVERAVQAARKAAPVLENMSNYVHESVASDFRGKLVAAVENWTNEVVHDGATVLTGGKRTKR